MKPFRTMVVVDIAVLLFFAASPLLSRGQTEPSDIDSPVVIFAIGEEDESRGVFRMSGFTGVHDYECDAEKKCVPEEFPARSYRMSAAVIADDSGVARITFKFRLNRDYNEVVLRLARWGAETDVITVDKKQALHVTNVMLGSNEDVHGVYDLNLGGLIEGRHTIQLTVAEDGKGNGRHSWDAITLFAK